MSVATPLSTATIDNSFGFERHFIRGKAKMQTRVGLALAVLMAMARCMSRRDGSSRCARWFSPSLRPADTCPLPRRCARSRRPDGQLCATRIYLRTILNKAWRISLRFPLRRFYRPPYPDCFPSVIVAAVQGKVLQRKRLQQFSMCRRNRNRRALWAGQEKGLVTEFYPRSFRARR
jgi:hypothetical protein